MKALVLHEAEPGHHTQVKLHKNLLLLQSSYFFALVHFSEIRTARLSRSWIWSLQRYSLQLVVLHSFFWGEQCQHSSVSANNYQTQCVKCKLCRDGLSMPKHWGRSLVCTRHPTKSEESFNTNISKHLQSNLNILLKIGPIFFWASSGHTISCRYRNASQEVNNNSNTK